MHDVLLLGCYPLASHLLYTQDGILDDTVPEERALGIKAGLEWGAMADVTFVYTDLGVTPGMIQGIKNASDADREIEYKTLPADVLKKCYERDPLNAFKKASPVTVGVSVKVLNERLRQEAKWGEQNHDTLTWLAILGEEVGEANQASLETRYSGKKTIQDYMEEMVQVAAVAQAAVECLDRNYANRDAVTPARMEILRNTIIEYSKKLKTEHFTDAQRAIMQGSRKDMINNLLNVFAELTDKEAW